MGVRFCTVNPLERDIFQRLEAVVSQLDDLLGADLLDQAGRPAVDERVFARAREYAARLEDPDPDVARQAAVALTDLVDTRDPADAATPLGVAVASTEQFEGQLLSQREAAALLGVSRQRVNDLMRPDKKGRPPRLERVGERVTRTSVARELGRRITKPLYLVERIDGQGQGQRQYLTDTGRWTTTPVKAARRFPTLKDARQIADHAGAYARGVTVRPFGETP